MNLIFTGVVELYYVGKFQNPFYYASKLKKKFYCGGNWLIKKIYFILRQISHIPQKSALISHIPHFFIFYLIYHTFAWHSKLWHMRQSSVFYMVYEIETKCTSISQIPHFLEVWHMRQTGTKSVVYEKEKNHHSI